MERHRGVVVAILGFLGGVACAALFSWGYGAALSFVFLGALFVAFFRKTSLALCAVGMLCICIAVGVAWYVFLDARLDAQNSWASENQKFTGRAFVVGDPELKKGRVRATLIPEGYSSRFLAYLPLNPRPARGDAVVVSGTLKRIENFSEDFDYVAYERVQGVLYELDKPKISAIEPAPWYSVSGILGRIRSSFLEVFRRVLPEPHASLLGGITIGADEGLEDLTPIFKTTGTSHIIVLSGYNITIVAQVVQSLLLRLGFLVSLWGGILGVALFTLMAGLSASSLRAALMAIIALVAKMAGREYQASRALIYAVALMVLINPRTLVYDVSFQLSVLATLGILYGPECVEKFFMWVPEKYGLRDAAITTAAAQIFVVPFIVYQFGTLSLVSLPANMLILPLVPLIMALGTITGLIGFLSTTCARLIALPVYGMLSYMISVAESFAAIPFASISLGKGSWFVLCALYVLVAWFLFPELWKRKNL